MILHALRISDKKQERDVKEKINYFEYECSPRSGSSNSDTWTRDTSYLNAYRIIDNACVRNTRANNHDKDWQYKQAISSRQPIH